MTIAHHPGVTHAPTGGVGARALTPAVALPAVLFVLGTIALTVPWLAMVRYPEQIVLLVLNLVLLTGSLAIGVSRGFRPMITLSAAFLLTWIALPSVFQLAHGLAAWHDDAVVQLRGDADEALLMITVAQGCLLTGYALASVLRRSGDSARHAVAETGATARRTPSPDPRKDRSVWAAAVLVAAALVALPVVAQVLGGVQVLFASRSGIQDAAADAGVALSESGGVGVALLRVIPMALAVAGALLAIQYLLRRPRHGWARVAGWTLSVAGTLLVIVYANPLANSRFTALAALGSVALLIARPRRSVAGVAVVVGFVAFMLFAYPLANAFRGDGASSLDDIQPAGGTYAYLASRDYDGFQQIINAILFVGKTGHTWGHYLLSAVLVFVPRSVWPDKATPASLDVAAARGYSFTDLSLPTNAELYIDFGWVGVVVVFLALGAAYAWLDRRWLAGERYSALVAFAALAQIGIIRGPLGSIVPVIDVTLLVLVVEAALHARARPASDGRT